ncbi:hypothetical protein [Streptomyces sp. NPDC053048]|uniref:hypothetical protein n=1 Tax=Streptomyces sp. NPDC053048 TaxID=3365694 RepID=UPI0037CE071A
MYRRPLRGLLYGLMAAVFACGGAVAAAPAAQAAAVCAPDPTAQGHRAQASGDPVEVRRDDGRVDRLQLFYETPGPSSHLPFVWHQAQDEPGGSYGPWRRVGATPVGPKLYQVTAAENRGGRLEVFFPSYGAFCHTVQDPDEDGWGPTEGFGLNPAPYHGGVVLFTEADGRLHAFASGSTGADSMQVRSQEDASSDAWGPVRSLGKVPDPFVGLGAPSSVVQLSDGRLRVVAREWNRDRYWQITERERFRSWGTWELCATQACG